LQAALFSVILSRSMYVCPHIIATADGCSHKMASWTVKVLTSLVILLL